MAPWPVAAVLRVSLAVTGPASLSLALVMKVGLSAFSGVRMKRPSLAVSLPLRASQPFVSEAVVAGASTRGAFVLVLNFFLLYRDAAQRGQSFVSDGMHTALRAFVPPMLVGGVVGICAIVFRADAPLAALIWILCYGLALLSTAHFSPRSLLRLGWAFLGLGLALTLWHFSQAENPLASHRTALASLYLGATFGALHIAYAVAVFLRKPAPLDPPDA